MNAAQHAQAAEQLLRDAVSGTHEGRPYYLDDTLPMLAAAQVHATLALAAAADRKEWVAPL